MRAVPRFEKKESLKRNVLRWAQITDSVGCQRNSAGQICLNSDLRLSINRLACLVLVFPDSKRHLREVSGSGETVELSSLSASYLNQR